MALEGVSIDSAGSSAKGLCITGGSRSRGDAVQLVRIGVECVRADRAGADPPLDRHQRAAKREAC
jgi:hypothetical protein